MPRKPRENVAGVYHVYARGNNRGRIFHDEVDRVSYLDLLGQAVWRMGWRCLAYCLMSNHVHLLTEIREPNLGAGIQWAHGLHAREFNDRHGRSGHVFQGRYGAKLVTSDEQLWHYIAYIARNPVRAGLCRAHDPWPWSSHGAVRSGHVPRWLDFNRVLELVGRAGGDPRRRYAELVGG